MEPISSENSSTQKEGKRLKGKWLVLLLLLLFVYHKFGNDTSSYTFQKTLKKATTYNSERAEKDDKIEHNGDVSRLLKKMIRAREKLEARVRVDYGKYFDIAFSKFGISQLIGISEQSMDALIEMIQVKLISAQLGTENTTFVWTTGGHSAAAGHGNLFSQSYTAMLEDTVKEVFASLDIDFIGRNHAMGGMQSGPELSCCAREIYGSDTDILSWDFGMTDGRDPTNLLLWSHRASMMREQGLPFLFYMNGPKDVFPDLEELGLPIGWKRDEELQKFIKLLPDYTYGETNLTDGTPRGVEYLRCGDYFETKGTPCAEKKWDTSICGKTRKQTSWHPGWKSHMFTGRLLGFFLIEALSKAIRGLTEESPTSNPVNETENVKKGITLEYLNHLLTQQALAKEKVLAGPFPEQYFNDDHNMTKELLYRGETVCHSSLLPSMTRFNNPKQKSSEYAGIAFPALPSVASDGPNPLQLVYYTDKAPKCEVTLLIDYKDVFLVRYEDGLVSTKLPSGTEIESGGNDLYLPDRKGVIMICTLMCDWNRCKDGSIQLSSFADSKDEIEITVNGEVVTNVRNLQKFCYLLENSSGSQSWGGGKQYNITFRVKKPKSFLEMTSIVIW